MTLKEALKCQLGPLGHPWMIGAETIILPLIAIGIGLWAKPYDPLWIHSSFSWAWFGPVILALRYGPFPGIGGAGILVVAWLGLVELGWITGEFPKLYFLGGLILVMLSSEFSSYWLDRARRTEGVQVYLDQRLEYLTHQYYLLRLSHDHLEQDLIGRPMAMRDALGILQTLIHDGKDTDPLPGAAGLIRLLAQYCQLEAAIIFAISNDKTGRTVVAARIGAPVGVPLGEQSDPKLDRNDRLVRQAIDTGTLAHVAENNSDRSRYIIAVPLMTYRDELIGVLVVERVPFFALHEEMLQTLNLLVCYYVDGLDMRHLAAQIRHAVPICPEEFAAELQRLHHVQQNAGANSIITALEFLPDSEFADLPEQIARQRRALDLNWLLSTPDRKILATIMPLAGPAAAEGYINRIEEWVRQKSGKTLTEAGIFPHVLSVSDLPPIELLHKLCDICHVSAEARLLRADA